MAHRFRLLVLDDEPVREVAAEMLRTLPDCEVSTTHDPELALERVRAGECNLLLTDLQMPGMSGAQVLTAARALNPALPVLVMTGFATVDNAVDLFRLGAQDFIPKPFTMALLLERVGRALERLRLKEEVEELRAQLAGGPGDADLVGTSPAMAALAARLPAVARSPAPVVILGETGTGKELVARAIHRLSPRAAGPFLAVNCGALPETLLESELFGHLRGAFTDAREDRLGLVGAARGGTLLLDEAGEMPAAVQVKLLRFLQEREYRPLGSTRAVTADVRVLAATHRDLRAEVERGRFREDLYYRLVVLTVAVPPLRERREDIPLLVGHFLRRHARTAPGPVRSFSPLALQRLQAHSWPGNVRELENIVLRALATGRRTAVVAGDLAGLLDQGSPGPAGEALVPYRSARKEALEAFERAYVERALRLTGGNIAEAARRAGKHPRAFWEIVRGLRRAGRDDAAAAAPRPARRRGKKADQ